MSNIVIGVEGLVGAGKTSICRNLLKKIPNSVLLNGGNLYRGIVYAMMKNKKDKEDKEEIYTEAKNIDIKEMMDYYGINIKIENNETMIYIENEKIDEELLQSKEASMDVSKIGGKADNKNLFKFARNLINKLKLEHNVIMSGRMNVTIYPEIDYNFFIIASLDERVKRKCIQYGSDENKEEIRNNIQQRDALQKEAGFYNITGITEEIDVTDCKSIEESTNIVLSHIKLLDSVI